MVSSDNDISAASLGLNHKIVSRRATCSVFHLIDDLGGDDGIALVFTTGEATAPDPGRARLAHVIAVACGGPVAVIHRCGLLR